MTTLGKFDIHHVVIHFICRQVTYPPVKRGFRAIFDFDLLFLDQTLVRMVNSLAGDTVNCLIGL